MPNFFLKYLSKEICEFLLQSYISYDKMNTNDKIQVNNELSQGISKLMAIAESYPELKANENFKDLSSQLVRVEEDIANARKYYN